MTNLNWALNIPSFYFQVTKYMYMHRYLYPQPLILILNYIHSVKSFSNHIKYQVTKFVFFVLKLNVRPTFHTNEQFNLKHNKPSTQPCSHVKPDGAPFYIYQHNMIWCWLQLRFIHRFSYFIFLIIDFPLYLDAMLQRINIKTCYYNVVQFVSLLL